eukprot:3738703-Prymnesium_polylepis.2
MYMTIPDCRVERQKHKFFVTFWASILWIGLLAFVMVTMAADIGDTIGARSPALLGGPGAAALCALSHPASPPRTASTPARDGI